MEQHVETPANVVRHAPRKVRRWTAILFALEVVVVVALVIFSWGSGAWT